MSKANIGKEALSGLTGGIEKAIIEIEDERFKRKEINKTKAEPRKASSETRLCRISNNLTNAVNEVKESTAIMLDKMPVLKTVEEIQQKAVPAGPKKKRFKVKFNPSQVSFSGVGGGRVEKKHYEDSDGNVQIEYQEMKPRIQMTTNCAFSEPIMRTASSMYHQLILISKSSWQRLLQLMSLSLA